MADFGATDENSSTICSALYACSNWLVIVISDAHSSQFLLFYRLNALPHTKLMQSKHFSHCCSAHSKHQSISVLFNLQGNAEVYSSHLHFSF